ncbi:hypothetical protein BX666DRAFT_178909 [Dichotomocladium elegans]|nr:hypothetical protein BX666DRAFT_178909 [Dichotomocladium elegans]
MTKISITTKMPMLTKQKLPIWPRTCCKWPTSSPASPTSLAARPKKVFRPVPITTASASPCLTVEPENTSSPASLPTGKDSPVSAAWSIETEPCAEMRRPSAGITSPSLMLITSPGTRPAASIVFHSPSRLTLHSGASASIRALTALPAWRSSKKPIKELASSSSTIPTKSGQSGALFSPLDRAIATIAAASITHERGFHINPRNCRNGLISFVSILL